MLREIWLGAQKKAGLVGSPLTIKGRVFDAQLDALISRHKSELMARGWEEWEANRILDWAISWILGWTTALTGKTEWELTSEEIRMNFQRHLSGAVLKGEKWFRRMKEMFVRPPAGETRAFEKHGELSAILSKAGYPDLPVTDELMRWLEGV